MFFAAFIATINFFLVAYVLVQHDAKLGQLQREWQKLKKLLPHIFAYDENDPLQRLGLNQYGQPQMHLMHNLQNNREAVQQGLDDMTQSGQTHTQAQRQRQLQQNMRGRSEQERREL